MSERETSGDNPVDIAVMNDRELLELLLNCSAELGRRAVSSTAAERVDFPLERAIEHAWAVMRQRELDIDKARASIGSVLDSKGSTEVRELVEWIADSQHLDVNLVQGVFNSMAENDEIVFEEGQLRHRITR